MDNDQILSDWGVVKKQKKKGKYPKPITFQFDNYDAVEPDLSWKGTVNLENEESEVDPPVEKESNEQDSSKDEKMKILEEQINKIVIDSVRGSNYKIVETEEVL